MRMPGLGRSTVLGLAHAGELPRLHTGRAVWFAVSDVEWMRSGEQLLMRDRDD
jgi:hypothetical protein